MLPHPLFSGKQDLSFWIRLAIIMVPLSFLSLKNNVFVFLDIDIAPLSGFNPFLIITKFK
jgi:uncharacterized membrane protein YhdT